MVKSEKDANYAMGFIEGSLPGLFEGVKKLAVQARQEAEETSVAKATEAKRKGKPSLLEDARTDLMTLYHGIERLMGVLALPHDPIVMPTGQGAPLSKASSEPLA